MLTRRWEARPGSTEAWLRRGFRALLAAALGVVFLLGARDLVRPFVAGASHTPASTPAKAFPEAGAEAFACRFAIAYLSYDSWHPDQRRQALQQYLAPGGDAAAGWDGQGWQQATVALPVGDQARDASHALITVAALVGGGRWDYLAVPVTVDGSGMEVGGPPALVPPPARSSAGASPDPVDQDPVLSSQLRSYLPAFLRAYAASSQDQLAYYAAPGAQLPGLGGQVRYSALLGVIVEQPSGGSRSAVVTVRWSDPQSGAQLAQRYRLHLVESGGKWLVSEVFADG